MYSFWLAGALASLLTRVTPTTYQVDVGNTGIFYLPNATTTRNIGDKVQFNFYNNHSVVEGGFNNPCLPLPGGFYSGFIAAPLDSPAAPQHFVVTIRDTEPHFFYCAQSGHCNAGMVGVINPASNQPDDLEAWAVLASKTDPNASPESISPPKAPIGGVINIESAAPVSAASDLSYSYELTAFASGRVAAPTNASSIPTAVTSKTTTGSIATPSVSIRPSKSGVSSITSIVTVAPTSSAALTSSTSATTSSLAPSASTKKGAAGKVDIGDTGLALLHLVVLVGIMLIVG